MKRIIRFFNTIIFLFKRRRVYPLLKIDLIRFILCKYRIWYFINIKRQLKIWNGSAENLITTAMGNSTIEHNLNGLHDVSGARALRIIKPLTVIETLRSLSEMPSRGGELNDLDYPCDAKVLTIGPRTEGEIYCLIGYGFKPQNIRGLDLISYSPYIDVGDMHLMPYENDAFDVVILSCVLVYSKNPQQACEEVLRIAKDGALICIAQDTVPEAGSNHIIARKKPTLFCQDYLELFQGYVKRVFFQHELPERLKTVTESQGSNYTMSLIFQINKATHEYA